MRVLFWNIERGYKIQGILNILKKEKADIYLFTEVDRGVKRTNKKDFFEVLKKELKKDGVYEREFLEKDKLRRYFLSPGGPGGGEQGLAILTNYKQINYKKIDLPYQGKLKWDGSTIIPEFFEPRSGGKKAQILKVKTPKGNIQIINTHIENWKIDEKGKRNQLKEIFKNVSLKTPTIFAGDLNNFGSGIISAFFSPKSGRKETINISKYLTSLGLRPSFALSSFTHFGFGFLKTKFKLDWLTTTSHFKVKNKKNVRTKHSDHNYLVIDIDL
jgi:endonuclease/exonuclease/phosphatase family metal-dependent hydrolase